MNLVLAGGDGGAGRISMKSGPHNPRMGPDGGDGGRGGRLVLVADPGVPDLWRLTQMRPPITAPAGKPGGKDKKSGGAGEDLFLLVPPGTMVENGGGKVVAELLEAEAEWALRGGRGGRGNARFATARVQAPRRAEPGRAGERAAVMLRLVIPCDTVILAAGEEGARLHESLTRRDYQGGVPDKPSIGVRKHPVLGHERILLLPPALAGERVVGEWLHQAGRAKRLAWAGPAPSATGRKALLAALPALCPVLLVGPGRWPGAAKATAEEWPAL